ncbi:MAG: response regulator transcription factor [Acidimicrobiia bacterium]
MTTPAQHILVIEDDPHLSEVVARYLQREGFDVAVEPNGAVGLQRALDDRPALVVLDLMLPGLDGLEVLRRLRRVTQLPVVLLTARGSEDDRITGLDLGADDYLPKPFSPRELVSRINAVLRRSAATALATADGGSGSVLRHGDLEVDLVSHRVSRSGEPVALTAKEFELLAYLMSHPGVALRREDILAAVWGWTVGDAATVTVHMRRLREKAESDPSQPRHLCTVRGVGYRFEP